MNRNQTLDPVSLGILWDRLCSITDEAVSALVRTSFSAIVRESYDLSVILLDTEGHLIAQGARSVPSFVGTGPPTLGHMLRRFPPETLRPGDVIATNDAWMGTGHLYDINVMQPVFRNGRIVAYTLSITHLPDIGGTGFSASAAEIYQEGLRLPICKLVEAGRPNELLLDVVRANVRTPEPVIGDIMANITCNEVGGRQVLSFLDEYGLDDLGDLSRAIRGQSELAMREKIRAIPDGRYRHEMRIEGIERPIILACTATVAGESVVLDLTGTSGPVNRGVNVPFCYTNAWARSAMKCLTTPTIPYNDGATVPVEVKAPTGCILNAQPPVATGARHSVGHFVTSLVFGTLAEAMPDQVQAESGMINLINLQGTHRDGYRFTAISFSAGGFGALAGIDGLETTSSPASMSSIPVEVWEDVTGTLIERKAFSPDSGGAGQARGGVGQEFVIRNDTGQPLTVHCMAYRTEFPAQGYLGGKAGRRRVNRLDDRELGPKDSCVMGPGQRLILVEAGGGGIGDPKARPRARVVEDVRQGFVTLEGARRDYGVDIAPSELYGAD